LFRSLEGNSQCVHELLQPGTVVKNPREKKERKKNVNRNSCEYAMRWLLTFAAVSISS
jgi:hypothetical protein